MSCPDFSPIANQLALMKRKLPPSQPSSRKPEALSHQVFFQIISITSHSDGQTTVRWLSAIFSRFISAVLAGGMLTRRLLSRSSRGRTFGFLVSPKRSFCREIKAHNSPTFLANENLKRFRTQFFFLKKLNKKSKVVVPCSIASQSLTQTFRNLFRSVFSEQ